MKRQPESNITQIEDVKKARLIEYNKQHYGNLINERRRQQNLTQAELGRRIGVAKANVTHWEAGRTRPDLNVIPDLCRELGISLGTFFDVPTAQESMTLHEQQHMIDYRRLSGRDKRIIDTTVSRMIELAEEELWGRCRIEFKTITRNAQQAAAGTGVTLEPENLVESVYVRKNRLSEHADEIVTVNGASMEPDFRDGQDVYVEHTVDLDIGEIGLFIVNGEGYIKQYKGDRLHSLNPEYNDIRLNESDNMRIVGRVLGVVNSTDYPTRDEQIVLEEISQEEK